MRSRQGGSNGSARSCTSRKESRASHAGAAVSGESHRHSHTVTLRARESLAVAGDPAGLAPLSTLLPQAAGAADDLDDWLDREDIPDGVPYLISPDLDYDIDLNWYFPRPAMSQQVPPVTVNSLIVSIHPGFGRVAAIRWFEMLVGVLMKQVAVALTLSVLLYCYSLIMGTTDAVLPGRSRSR
jgi:hypothetical protein